MSLKINIKNVKNQIELIEPVNANPLLNLFFIHLNYYLLVKDQNILISFPCI